MARHFFIVVLVAISACGPVQLRGSNSTDVHAGNVSFPVRTTGVRLLRTDTGAIREVHLFAADAGDACTSVAGESATTHLVHVHVFGQPPGKYSVSSAQDSASVDTPLAARITVLKGDDVLATANAGQVILGELTEGSISVTVRSTLEDGSTLNFDLVANACE